MNNSSIIWVFTKLAKYSTKQKIEFLLDFSTQISTLNGTSHRQFNELVVYIMMKEI